MARERRGRSWWVETVRAYRGSGLSAAAFAAKHGLKVGTLRWWSSELGRGATAERQAELAPVVPLAVRVDEGQRTRGSRLEVSVGEVVVRFDDRCSPGYVAELVRELSAAW